MFSCHMIATPLYVVCAVAADLASVAVAVGRFFRDLEFACLIVEFRRNVREAVDSGMIFAASFPRPFRITRSGRSALLAFFAIPIAPSAAAKLSCPARNAKHFVSSFRSIAARLPCPIPTLRSSATLPGIQKDWRPSPVTSRYPELICRPSSLRSQRRQCTPSRRCRTDRLNVLDDLLDVYAQIVADLLGFFEGADSVLVQSLIDLIDSSFVTFELYHDSLLLFSRIDILRRISKRP